MRNGWNGVGIVNGSTEMPEHLVSAFVGLDATLELSASETLRRICPVMVRMEGLGTRWRYDVIEFIVASQDDAGAELVRESTAGRVIFIGRPGPKTKDALSWFASGLREANVIPTPKSKAPLRIVWRGLDTVLIESAPEWQPRPLPKVAGSKVDVPVEVERPVPPVEEVREEDQDPNALINVLAPFLEE